MNENDLIRLRHMADAARQARRYARRRGRGDSDSDEILALAIVKLIEVIGEAAARVTPDTRERLDEVSWPQIVAMRNILIHVYYDIDYTTVWKTVTDDLPPLIAYLERIISAEQGT